MAAVLRDAYGLTVSSDSRAAVDGYDRGVRALLGFAADTVTAFTLAWPLIATIVSSSALS